MELQSIEKYRLIFFTCSQFVNQLFIISFARSLQKSYKFIHTNTQKIAITILFERHNL